MFISSRRLLIKFRISSVSVMLMLISSLMLFIFIQNRIGESLGASSRHDITIDQNIVTFDSSILNNYKFNISDKDLLVLLHIQKTGGTAFERHLVNNLRLEFPCKCNDETKRRCICPRSNKKKPATSIADITWLVSRFSTGWICGLHPDFTQLSKCLANLRRLFFITYLRHPVHRFISEFRHVRRGATWKASKGYCKQYDTQLCYEPQSQWSNVTLDQFIECPNNMAINRQTRMLASYNESIACDNSAADDDILLTSAKTNLEKISFFGICEKQRASQILFEKTFNLHFTEEYKQSEDNRTREFISELEPKVLDRISGLNNLDLQLYNYALNLFASRCKTLTNTSDCTVNQ